MAREIGYRATDVKNRVQELVDKPVAGRGRRSRPKWQPLRAQPRVRHANCRGGSGECAAHGGEDIDGGQDST